MGSVVAQYVTGQTLVGAISDNGHHAERAIGEFIGREAPGTVGHRPRLAASLRRLGRLVPAGIHSLLAGRPHTRWSSHRYHRAAADGESSSTTRYIVRPRT
jgi:hypothetical protein